MRKALKREKKKRGKGHVRDTSIGSIASFGSIDVELVNADAAAQMSPVRGASTNPRICVGGTDGGDDHMEVLHMGNEPAVFPSHAAPPPPPPSPTHGMASSVYQPREYKPKAGECSIESSLAALFREERLDGEDCFACETCYAAGARNSAEGLESPSVTDDENGSECSGYVMRDAKKHFCIERCPPVLAIHLKRFEQHGPQLYKVSRHVSFDPVIDISHFCDRSIPFVVGDDGRVGVLYELYAVVQHTGSLQSGHYTAYIKDTVVPSKGGPAAAQWFHVSDEKYTVCTLAEVLRAEAYILFYERIGVDQIGSSTTRVTGL
eukprot:m.134822 g.134822  ORF g.134822 m.134822 type:complete len:320 (-) comp11400_c0_seq2:128-1087(-)